MGSIKNLSLVIATTGLMLAATTQAQAVSLSYDSSIGRPANLAQGEFPGVPGTLAVPQGVAVQESTGNVFVANGRGIDRVEVFDSKGNYIKGIGETGKGPGQFDEPAALAFDPYGNLYAGDVFNNRVNVFDNEGKFVKSIADGQFGGLIEGRAFFGPSAITFDKNGIGYVGDFSGDRILKFDNGGNIVGSIGSSGTAPGQFQGPAGIAISPNSGNFYVSDQFNNRIQVLDPEGKPILTFGEQGSGPGQFLQPIDLEVDKNDNVYVMDSINSRVQIFDKDGKFLSAYGEPSGGRPPQLGEPSPYGNPLDLSPGKFNWTAGSYLDEGDNKLYVGDFFQGRVQVLNVNNSEPVPEPTSMLGIAVLGAGAIAGKLKQRSWGKEKVKG